MHSIAVRTEHFRAAGTLALDLVLHDSLQVSGRIDILNLHTGHSHSPAFRIQMDLKVRGWRSGYLLQKLFVDSLSRGEGIIQSNLCNDVSEGSLTFTPPDQSKPGPKAQWHQAGSEC